MPRASKELEAAAGALKLKVKYLDVLSLGDFEKAFEAASKEQMDAVVMLVWGAILNPHRKTVADLAAKSRLPTIYQQREHVEAGGLMTYGLSEVDLNRRAAIYVDKILKALSLLISR